MRIVLFLSSAVVLAFTALAFFEENLTADWRAHQLEYRRLLAERSAWAEPPEIRLRQVYLPEMRRVDRCVTCHVAIEDSAFTDVDNPLKTHPGNYLENHPPQKFGCTVCHDGQGRATNWADAAARSDDAHWSKPLLGSPFLEASCYRCHRGSLEQTPHYGRGRRLFETGGCLGCHQRDGRGGYLAPELRGLGDAAFQLKTPTAERREELLGRFDNNRNLAYIYESVRFPSAQPEDSVMIDYGFADEDAIALAVYLKSLTEPLPGMALVPEPRQKPLPIGERGRRVFELYCRACHGPQGSGGVENPNYLNGTIPGLDLLAERMFLYEREDAETFIAAIEEFGAPPVASPEGGAPEGEETQPDPARAFPSLDLPRLPVVLAQYTAIRETILDGNPAGKLDPEGPTPFNMPSWRRSIPEDDIDAVIVYLISIYEFEDY